MKCHAVVLFLSVAVLAMGTACQNKKGPGTVSGLKRVHFDFDSASIKPDMVAVLDANAKYLTKNKSLNIIVEGHCDERGTNEYNMALGDRRATTTKNYLIRQGVATDRLRVVSFGEEQPLEGGHSEASWYMNRRAEFVKQ